ncbi:MAG TPA: adenylate/guanylate cyclase domain-containing protein [Thermoanaerobaculia bacterium]
MKILWLDDRADRDVSLQRFAKEWRVEKDDVLAATDLDPALDLLRTHRSEIKLAVVDLLWRGQAEKITEPPLGIEYVRKIRHAAPELTIVTRSRITNPQLLAGLYHDFRQLHVEDHFVVTEKDDPVTLLRRRNLLDRVGTELQRPLAAYLGERWGVVLFADVSGFTTATEQLWHSNRHLLVEALGQFYDQAAKAIADQGGIVDKLIGDEVMGIFIAEGGRDTHEATVRSAVESALAIYHGNKPLSHRFAIRRWIESDDSVDEIPWSMKIGMEAGSLVLREHSLTAQQRELCTIGYAVNVASRIKGYFPDAVTLGPTLFDRLPRAYKVEESPTPVAVKGLNRMLRLYKLVV